MNYFQLYGIPEAFHPNELLIKRKFYELSKQYHPDFYVSDSEEKQQEILELSTLNNKAYQVLSDPRKRMAYILDSNGLMEEGEKHALPPDFLMEMMEINEALMELEIDPDPLRLEEIISEIGKINDELEASISNLGHEYDRENADKKSILLKLKDLYYRQKYLLRIMESLTKFAAR